MVLVTAEVKDSPIKNWLSERVSADEIPPVI